MSQETWMQDDEVETVTQWVYRKQKKDRTAAEQVYFFGHLAKDHGVHLAALVFHVAKWTSAKVHDGRSNWTYDPTCLFAAALGVSDRHLRRLVRKARRLKLLDWHRSVNQINLWIMDHKLYKVCEGITWYHRDLAELIGMTESLLYRVILDYTVNVPADRPLPGYAANYGVWQTTYPFLSEGAIRNALSKLTVAGLIKSDYEGTHHICQNRRYYATEAKAGVCGKALKLALGIPLKSAPNKCSYRHETESICRTKNSQNIQSTRILHRSPLVAGYPA